MQWFPIGPDFVQDPRALDPQRIAFRNMWGSQGRVNCIAFDPPDGTASPTTVYTVGRDMGLPDQVQLAAFRRGPTDSGWKPISDPLRQADPNVDPSWLSVSPHDPAMIYLGTFEDRGVYVSGDRGDSWGPRVALGGRIRKLIVDPRPPVGAASTILYAATDNGVFRSGDNGLSWTPVLDGDVWSLALQVDSGGTPHCYAGVWRSGVWYANTDPTSAAAWTHVNAMGIGLPLHSPGDGSTPENFNAVLVDVCTGTPTRAYAWFAGPTSPGSTVPAETVGLYTTGSPGSAWSLVNPSPTFAGTTETLNPMQGFNNFVFSVAPNSPGDGSNDILFFGNIGNGRSVDGGVTWQPVRQFFHNDMHGHAFFPSRFVPGEVPAFYIGCDGGLGRNVRAADPAFPVEVDLPASQYNAGETVAADSGTFINQNAGLQNSLVYVLGGDPDGIAPPYLGSVDTGLNVKDGGLGWRTFGPGDSFELAVAIGSDGVKIWEKVHLGSRKGVRVGTDNGGFDLASGGYGELFGELSSKVMPWSNFVGDGSGRCLIGASVEETVTTTTDIVPAGTDIIVQVVSTAEIPEGQYLAIGIDATRQAATAFDVGPTSFRVPLIYQEKPAGSPVRLIRPAVVRVDETGESRRISQYFEERVRNVGFTPSSVPRTIVCETSDQRLWRVDEAATLAGPATWDDISARRPPGAEVASLVIGSTGEVFVLLLEAATVDAGSGPFETPLFRIGPGATSWEGLSCSGLPTGSFPDGTSHPFGKMVADPVTAETFYASHGADVYRVRRQIVGGSDVWEWNPVGAGLPGCWISDLWVGNIAGPSSGAAKIILRAGVLGRGVWETAVTAGDDGTGTGLYLRRHMLDQGWLDQLRDGLPNPYEPSRRVWHYQCADAKIEAPVTGSGGAFFQTDPESSGTLYSTSSTPPGPISNVVFDLLRDDSRVVPEGTAVRVHVQLQNRSYASVDGIRVWALYTPVAAGVPALGSRTGGGTFPFWDQFQSDGSIVPALPADSWWQAVGPPLVLDGLDVNHPRVASWLWTAPALAPGEYGHYCLGIFVHGAESPVGETTRTSLDLITQDNKQVGQKNLHIVSAGSGGGSGGGAESGAADTGGDGLTMSPTFAWFHNPTNEHRKADLVFDFRGLPEGVEVAMRFTPVQTDRPIQESLEGARVEGPGCLSVLLGPLKGLLKSEKRGETPTSKTAPAFLKEMPLFDQTGYVIKTPTLARVKGVHLGPLGWAAVRMELRYPPGAGIPKRDWFEVQQVVDEKVAGGSSFLVRSAVAGLQISRQRMSQEEFGEMEEAFKDDSDGYNRPWIRRIREAAGRSTS